MISVSLRGLAIAVAVAFLAAVAWAVFEFQPERQLGKTFERFVANGERRAWDKVGDSLAHDYRDAWGFDRTTALDTARELFGQFFVLEISTEPVLVEVDGKSGTVTCLPRLAGNGTAIAQMIITRANALEEPMMFTWRRESWKPWDWKLTSTRQPEIEASGF